jgi:acid phosphatase (class A)
MKSRIIRWAGAGVLLAALGGCSSSPPQALSKPPAAPASASTVGYLSDMERSAIQLKDILPAPPALKVSHSSSARYEADRKVYKATRPKNAQDPRYIVALADDNWHTDAQLKDFSCAAGVQLDANAPKLKALINLLDNVTTDSIAIGDPAKAHFERKRPFVIDPDGAGHPIRCGNPASYDYPSGHSTGGWIIGLILAEMLPERATPIFMRARAYADSRVVCGVHNLSATSAGQMSASVLVARLHANEAFRGALQKAETDLHTYMQSAPRTDEAQCRAEYDLLVKTPY